MTELVIITLPPKTATEAKVVTADFSIEAAASSTLSSPVVEKSLISGTDTSAALLNVSSAVVSGKFALALVAGGVVGSRYGLLFRVSGSNGEVHECPMEIDVVAVPWS